MYKSKSRIFLTYKPNFALSRVVVLLFFVIACIGCHSFSLVGFVTLAPNGSALGTVADFGAQNCQYTTKVDAR